MGRRLFRAPPGPLRPHDGATPRSHSGTGAATKLSKRGEGRKAPHRGRVARYPGRGRIRGGGGVSNVFGGVSFPTIVSVSPVLGLICVEGVFSGDGTISSPAPEFWLSGRALDNARRVRGFSPMFLAFLFFIFSSVWVFVYDSSCFGLIVWHFSAVILKANIGCVCKLKHISYYCSTLLE